MTDIENHALAVTIKARILVLWQQRQRDRRWMGATWTPARHDREKELRSLVKLMRSARKLAGAQPDPMTLAKGEAWEAWTNGELVAAFGR